jgi:hypothetical protein
MVPSPEGCDDLVGIGGPLEGLGLGVCSLTKRLMAAWSSTMERKTPRLSRRFDNFAKKPSTVLSHEQDVGTKWKVQRG